MTENKIDWSTALLIGENAAYLHAGGLWALGVLGRRAFGRGMPWAGPARSTLAVLLGLKVRPVVAGRHLGARAQVAGHAGLQDGASAGCVGSRVSVAVYADGTNVLVESTAQGYLRILYDEDFAPVITGGMDAVRADVRRNAPDLVFLDLVKWERGVYVRIAPREYIV